MEPKYSGPIPASKSVFNRWQVIRSFNKQIHLLGESDCDDVVSLKKALLDLEQGKNTIEAGEGGTTFRFLTFLISRRTGDFLLKAHANLLKRPQKEISNVLSQLGVTAEWKPEGLLIQSKGWQNPSKPVQISLAQSSQFLSGLLLSSWDLSFDLSIQIGADRVSESYLDLTLETLKKSGLEFNYKNESLVVFKAQTPKTQDVKLETDMSSVFSIAVLAALRGSAQITDFNYDAHQPDSFGLDLLRGSGIRIEEINQQLLVYKKEKVLKPVVADLKNSPDLFPVLAVFCSQIDGVSELYGASHLVFKESDRLSEVIQLLNLVGVKTEAYKDGIRIYGSSKNLSLGSVDQQPVFYHPAHDHRMAMAAEILRQATGRPLVIQDPNCVSKSFPNFWQIAARFVDV